MLLLRAYQLYYSEEQSNYFGLSSAFVVYKMVMILNGQVCTNMAS